MDGKVKIFLFCFFSSGNSIALIFSYTESEKQIVYQTLGEVV
jgi:hypothetical protein